MPVPSYPYHSTKMPELIVRSNPPPLPRRSLDGWERLNLWAYHNHPTWHRTNHPQYVEWLTEIEKLQLLAYHLLKEVIETRAALSSIMRSPHTHEIILTPHDSEPPH